MSRLNKRAKLDFVIYDINAPADQLLNIVDEIGDEHPGTIFGPYIFSLIDFKFLETAEFGGKYGHSGISAALLSKHTDYVQKCIENNQKICVVEGYYYLDRIALISDNKTDLSGNAKEEDDFLLGSSFKNVIYYPSTADKEKAASVLLQKLNVKKVYALHIPKYDTMKRLAKLLKNANYGDWMSDSIGDFFTIDNGSMTNVSNYMYHAPLGIYFPDFQNNYISRKDRTYGPTIERKWRFIEPNTHPEWLMRDI